MEYRRFSGNLTLFCCYYIPYFTHKLQINANWSSWAKWAGSDVTACLHMISFSNGCALIPQPEALENVFRAIIHYLNMKWEKWSQKLHQNCLNNNKDSFVLDLKTKVGRIVSLLHPLWEDSNAVFLCTGIQCPKLRVHPAPEVHDFTVGCMEMSSHAPGNAFIFLTFNIYHIKKCAPIYGRVHGFEGPCTQCVHQKNP